MARKKQTSSNFKNIFRVVFISAGAIFLSIVLLLLTTFFVVKHLKIKDLVEQEIEQQLGINVTINKLSSSYFLTRISAEGVVIHNPPGFKETELAYLNYVHLVWDPLSMIVLNKPNIYLCAVDLERLNIIKNERGKVNIKELMPVKDQGKVLKDETQFFFDVLVLSVGKVTYTAPNISGKKTRVFNIGIKNQAFVALQNEDEVVKLIIYKALENTDIGKMINMAVTPVFSGVSNTFDSAWGTTKLGAKSVVDIMSTPFKLIFNK